MSNLLKNVYDRAEGLRGKNLLVTLLLLFLIFLSLGILIGNITNKKLTKDELNVSKESEKSIQQPTTSKNTYEGYITYLGKDFYPGSNIIFSLTDSSGKDIILLQANDSKLQVAEGLKVKVSGTVSKNSVAGKEVLMVEEVMLNNATN